MNIYDGHNPNSGFGQTANGGIGYRPKPKSTYLSDDYLSPTDPGSMKGPSVKPLQTPRDRREMFRYQSGVVEGRDVQHLHADKDLSPGPYNHNLSPPNGRDQWSTPSDTHNRSVSTTSNNNGYHSNHDSNDNRVNGSVSTNYDTLDRSVFSSPNGSHAPNGSLLNGSLLNGSQLPNGSILNSTHLPNGGLLNRSKLSVFNSTSVDQSVLSQRSMNDLNKNVTAHHQNDLDRSNLRHTEHNRSIITYKEPLNNGDYIPDTSTHTKIPTHQQNGFLHSDGGVLHHNVKTDNVPASGQNQHNVSRGSLAGVRVISGSSVQSTLVNMAFLCLMSLVVAVIALQILFRLSARSTVTGAAPGGVLSNESYSSTREVAVATGSVVIMLDLCCLMVGAMQAVFAAKLLRCSDGQQRAFKYLKECASTRFIAVAGFFISVPFLLLTILLYLLMEFRTTSAIISTVVMATGLIFILLAVVHSTMYWRREKDRAERHLPVYDSHLMMQGIAEGTSPLELSTLV